MIRTSAKDCKRKPSIPNCICLPITKIIENHYLEAAQTNNLRESFYQPRSQGFSLREGKSPGNKVAFLHVVFLLFIGGGGGGGGVQSSKFVVWYSTSSKEKILHMLQLQNKRHVLYSTNGKHRLQKCQLHLWWAEAIGSWHRAQRKVNVLHLQLSRQLKISLCLYSLVQCTLLSVLCGIWHFF